MLNIPFAFVGGVAALWLRGLHLNLSASVGFIALFRRAWATSRKDLSLTDVAEAGGWKDTTTLLKCYTQPDAETVTAVVLHDRPVRTAGN